MVEAMKVKEDRRRKHSRAGKEKPKAERKSMFPLILSSASSSPSSPMEMMVKMRVLCVVTIADIHF